MESRPLADGYYKVLNVSSGKVLDDPNFSTTNGTVIQQYQSNGGLNQQGALLRAGNDPVRQDYVANAYSDKVLDDANFSTANGTQIIQYQLNGGSNQQWKLFPLADGNYTVVNASSGKVLDNPNFSTSNGAVIQQYQANGGLNQQWSLAPVDEKPGINVQTTLDQTGGWISISGQGFTPNSLVPFYVDGLVSRSQPLAIGSIMTVSYRSFHSFGYEAWIWSVYQTEPATVRALDFVTGAAAIGETWAFSV